MAEKICLVDGSGYIFRAFYGLPPMTAPDGTPVNGVYGFTNMFMKLSAKFDCKYNLVLFDAKRKCGFQILKCLELFIWFYI